MTSTRLTPEVAIVGGPSSARWLLDLRTEFLVPVVERRLQLPHRERHGILPWLYQVEVLAQLEEAVTWQTVIPLDHHGRQHRAATLP